MPLAFFEPDHRRDAQRPRHDGGVRGAAADVGREADAFLRSSCAVFDGVRSWAMMMHGSVRWARSGDRSTRWIVHHAPADVAHVGGAFAHYSSSTWRRGTPDVTFRHPIERVFGVDLSCWITRTTSSITDGSSNTRRCASKMLACPPPEVG